jgi:hypothetical protein
MDWIQTLTIIGSMFIGLLALYKIHREDINKMDSQHREDINKMDLKIDKMDAQHREDMRLWAALFEKFHILDKDVAKFSGKLDNFPK